MFNLKKYSLLILLIMLIFVLIPVSFAGDIDNTTSTDEIGLADNSDVLSDDDDEAWIDLESTEYSIDEGDQAYITGSVYIEIIDDSYPYGLNVECKYVDDSGNVRSYTSYYNGYEFKFDTGNFKGLVARENPYILNISVVEDDLFEDFVDFYYIDKIAPSTVSLSYNKAIDFGPTLPDYKSFTPVGQIYVEESGSDSNDGSELSPYATIQWALDRNKALGGNYEIIVKEGRYFFTEAYTISNNVRITGKGKVEIINSGTSSGYIFFTSGANIIEFNNLTISGGTSGAISGSTTSGGSGNAGKVLNIINCTFEDNSGYVGVITTYSETTIIQSTFINNVGNGISGSFRGLISARDNFLTVNFCNFIENRLSSGNPIIYSEVKTNVNYNFWGSNEGISAENIMADKLQFNYWAVIVPQIDENVIMGNDYDLMVKFMYANANGSINNLNASMPNLNINVKANLAQIDSNVFLKNNISVINYVSPEKGLENVSVSLNDKIITYITFDVQAPELDKIYVSPFGSDTNDGTNENPLKTIKAAIDKNHALGGNKVIVILPGSYEEFDLEINDAVTIVGQEGVVINANKKGRIFVINSNVDIYNITFTDAYVESDYEYYNYGGAIYHNSGNLNIYDSEFNNNFAENCGGAIASQSTGILGIYNTKFTNNMISEYSSELKGTVIYSDAETVISNSQFVNNVMSDAQGSVYLGNDANIINNRFINNEASYGGAIYVNGGTNANILIKNNNFTSNKATSGGAIFSELNSLTLIENNTFEENSASNGGAIYLYGINSQNKIADNSFLDNTNDAIYVRSAQVDLENNTIYGNIPQINVNSGFIGNILITFNQNKTLKLKDGEIELNVTVTDDMGNVINGGVISFTSNGDLIGQGNVVNGKATLLKQFETGDYIISGTYSASNNLHPPLEVKDSLIRINVENYWFIGDIGYETLQEAIDAAEINDVIKGIPGVYDEPIIQIGHRTRPSEPWVINKNITITSLNDQPVVLNAADRYIFYIDYYSNVTFRNIIFTGANNPNGWAGAIDSMGKNTIVVENCTFMNNLAEKGGAIYGYGNLYIKDCLFINNTATVYGGAVVKDGDGDFILENVKFINNSAFTYSGAVDCRGYSDVIQIFKNVTFEGNNATCAGALYTSGKNVTFIDCVFDNNKAIDKDSGYSPMGGAVYVHYGSTKFINTKFTNNYADGTGGALQLENTVSSVVNSSGRYITIYWGILEDCLIENNTATGDGGAIFTGETFRTYINITNTVIRNNTAANGALFVNLFGFYTLNNVTAENNKNTAGSSLIYTYGMYSFPESFYANTNIINSTFKDNIAERFISTTTIYSSVNITNSVFENMGMILYSYEGSICNLTNVSEINSNADYSIDNTGTLSLCNNTFLNPIYNKAIINTPTFIYVCNNGTFVYEIGESIKLEAVIVDDNNNVIIGPELVFVVNDKEIDSKLENVTFIADYTVIKGIQLVSVNYTGNGLSDLTIKTAIIEGKSNLLINSSDISVYYRLDKYCIVVKDIKGNPVSDIKLLINIAGSEYVVDSDLNGVILIDLDLSKGIYPVNIKFDGNDRYNSLDLNSTITVLSTISSNDTLRGFNSPYDFIAIFTDNSGNPLNNTNVSFKVNNIYYNLTTDEYGAAKLTKLAVGTYTVISINPVTSEEITNNVVITKRIINNKNIVMDYRDGSKFKVRVIGDDGKVIGDGEIVKFTVNGKTYKVKTNKNGYAYLPINLAPKTYKITAEYKGYKVSNKIKVKSVIKAKNISKKKAKKIKYTATLKNSKGKALKGKKVTFKIKGKTYKAKTNKKGVAKVYLKKLKVGKHKITIKYLSSRVTKTVKIKR